MVTPLGPLTPEMPVSLAGFSVRARKAILRLLQLNRDGRLRWPDLAEVTLATVATLWAEELLELRNFGPSSLKEIEDKLAEAGLALADRTLPPGALRPAPSRPEGAPARPRLNDQLLWLADRLGVDAGGHATDTGLAVAVWQRVREDVELAQKCRQG